MSLADHPQLDVATLRAVAWGLRAGLLADVLALGEGLVGLGARVAASESAEHVEDAIAGIERLAAEREAAEHQLPIPLAEALPPRLSDWIRACEGTAHGEPRWAVQTAPGARHALIAIYGPDAPTPYWPCVELLDWMDEGDERFRDVEAVTAIVWCDKRCTPCTTIAELRAALERLAKVAQP